MKKINSHWLKLILIIFLGSCVNFKNDEHKEILNEHLLDELISSNYQKMFNNYEGKFIDDIELNKLHLLKSKTQGIQSSIENPNKDSINLYFTFIKELIISNGINEQLEEFNRSTNLLEKRKNLKFIEFIAQEKIKEAMNAQYFDFDQMYVQQNHVNYNINLGDTFKATLSMCAFNSKYKAKAIINGNTLLQDDNGFILFTEKAKKRFKRS